MLDPATAALADMAYEAAFDPTGWARFTRGLGSLLDGAHATLLLPGPEPALERFFSTLDPACLRSYVEHFQAVDPHVAPHMSAAPVGRFYFGHELVPVDQLLGTEFWADWMKPQGLRPDAVFGYGFEHAPLEDFSGLGFWRLSGGRSSDAEDLQRVQDLAPHLDRAVRLGRRAARLRADRDALAGVLDQLPSAVVLLDGRGQVRHANRAALRLASRNDGFSITRGGLRAGGEADSRELQRTMADALSSAQGRPLSRRGALRLGRPSGKEALEVLVTPIRVGAQGAATPVAAVFVGDPESETRPPHALLRRLFGLSRSESSLALELASGYSLAEAARKLGVRDSTARTTLKGVFTKVGVSRQAELVRRLAAGVASLAPEDDEGG